MCPIIIWPRGSIAARDPHSGDTRVGKDNAEEGQTCIAWRSWDKAAEDQPPINPEALDARAGLTVSVRIARPASVRQVNVREDRAEAADLCRHISIGAGYEEQRLGDVAVHWGEQPQKTEGTEDGAVGRIVEERSQAALGSARRGSLRKARPRRGELGAARVQERGERRDRGCRRIVVAPAVPVDFAVTTFLRKRPWQ